MCCKLPLLTISFLLHGLLSSLGLAALHSLGGGCLDDTNSDGLSHVTDSESSERRIVGESFDTHWLAGGQQDDGGISRLDELGVVLNRLTGTTVNLLLDLSKLASNVSCVTIKDRRVSVADLARMIEDNDLGSEVLDSGCWLVLGVGGDISSLDVLDGDVLDVEADVVSGDTLGQHVGGKGAGLDDAVLHPAHRDCADTSDFVDVLEGQSEGGAYQ